MNIDKFLPWQAISKIVFACAIVVGMLGDQETATMLGSMAIATGIYAILEERT